MRRTFVIMLSILAMALAVSGLAGSGLAAPVLTALGVAHPSPAGRQDDPGESRVLFTLADPRITEASGLAVSLRHEGVFYTQNDSGDEARFFAVDRQGRTVATYTLRGAQGRDIEAIAVGPDERGRPSIFLADIGDNDSERSDVTVYRVGEPDVLTDATLEATPLSFRYADGPRNAEALLVHPRTGRLLVVSKEAGGGRVYEAPANLSPGESAVLSRIADAPVLVTDGAYSPDGSRLALRGYEYATVYRAPGAPLGDVDVPDQKKGESVAFTSDGRALLFGSEGRGSEVWQVPLPGNLAAGPATGEQNARTSSAGPETAEADAGDSGRPAALAGLVLSAVVIVAALAAVGIVIARNPRRRARGRRG